MAEKERHPGWPDARWYYWDGGFLNVSPTPTTSTIPRHSHHAIQLWVGIEGIGRLQHGASEEWHEYQAAVVNADEPHAYNPVELIGIMIMVDPESREGRWLASSLNAPVQPLLASRLSETQAAVRQFIDEPPDLPGTTQFVDYVVRQFCTGIMPNAVLDDRIAKILSEIQEMDAINVSLDEMAAKVFLSPSRFAHLFTDEVGIPFRRYMLWRRLNKAVLQASRGENLSRAAVAAGFSDSAHLTRTFYDMFGLPPTAMLKIGKLYEIPAPFRLARASS